MTGIPGAADIRSLTNNLLQGKYGKDSNLMRGHYPNEKFEGEDGWGRKHRKIQMGYRDAK